MQHEQFHIDWLTRTDTNNTGRWQNADRVLSGGKYVQEESMMSLGNSRSRGVGLCDEVDAVNLRNIGDFIEPCNLHRGQQHGGIYQVGLNADFIKAGLKRKLREQGVIPDHRPVKNTWYIVRDIEKGAADRVGAVQVDLCVILHFIHKILRVDVIFGSEIAAVDWSAGVFNRESMDINPVWIDFQ